MIIFRYVRRVPFSTFNYNCVLNISNGLKSFDCHSCIHTEISKLYMLPD